MSAANDKLAKAATELLKACYRADADEELSGHIDGRLLDEVKDALAGVIADKAEAVARRLLAANDICRNRQMMPGDLLDVIEKAQG